MGALTVFLATAIAAGSAAAQQTMSFSGDELPEGAMDTSVNVRRMMGLDR
ncbi:MAG: hypothetical protein U9R79_16465 [Armatimonadota bacterium]|nr:hypothetical protein [Armatimonadota bacterium]